MRNKLLISTAVLLAGLAYASAQQIPGGGQSGGAVQKQESPSGSKAQSHSRGGETGRSGGESQRGEGKGQHERTTGQGQREQGKQAQPRGKEGKQTTGQRHEEGKGKQRDQAQQERKGKQPSQAQQERKGKQAEQSQQERKGKQPEQAQQERKGKQPSQAQQERKGNQPSQAQQERKGNQPSQAQQERKGKQPEQAQQERKGKQPEQAQQGKQAPTTTGQGQQPQQQGRQQGQQGRAGQQGKAQQNKGRITLNEQQSTRIRETVLTQPNVPRVNRTDVNFQINVGTVVPSRVRVVPVTPALVAIRPEFRDDLYFVVDDEIVITDHNRRIVSVVSTGPSGTQARGGGVATSGRGGAAASGRGGQSSLSLSQEEIRRIQEVLIQKGFNIGVPDGRLGAKTRQALISFQKQQGLRPNGQIDSQTVAALGVNVRSQGGSGGQGTAGQAGGQQPSAQDGGQRQPSTTGQGGAQQSPANQNMEGQQGSHGDANAHRSPGNQDQGNVSNPPANQQPPQNNAGGDASR